ncbi:UPF0014-domain-containing protein [Rhizopus microsporus]|uniref:UPF0014-domain-containing protein n=1 Tax=Rhizopus microsporus TaxID=58291 RepID=A0A1X0S8X4_RHIZD|nr:UPF0014-domain-containing protein [Rhizopus microsporus]
MDLFLRLFSDDPNSQLPDLSWYNVAIASSFLVVNGIISLSLGLKLEKSLLTSSIRCIIQLTIMGSILENVFKARHPVLAMLMTFVLVFLSSIETVYNKSEWSFNGMFPSVFLSTAFSTFFIGIVGTRYAMNERQFWLPELFIPTIGLLLGITTGAIAVGISSCLKKAGEESGQIETYLSYGASREEAGRSIAKESIRLALLPTINRMSVIGLITIPGAMTGQILGGAPIMKAVMYQQIITFMISATSSLSVLGSVYYCLHRLIDKKHRLRTERVHKHKANILHDIKSFVLDLCCFDKITTDDSDEISSSGGRKHGESSPLLNKKRPPSYH